MKIDLSFKDVCKFVKNDYPELTDDMDALLGLVLISSVVFTGNPAFIMNAVVGGALANIFGVKSELSKIGKKIIGKITEKKANNPLLKPQRMEAAYCLICYTAFFEAIDHQPTLSEFRKATKLTPEEKIMLSKSAFERKEKKAIQLSGNHSKALETDLLKFPICLPHPIDRFDTQSNQLLPLYQELTKGFLSFLECLALWDSLDETKQAKIKKAMEEVPKQSLQYFKAQYFILANKYEEFYVWSNLHEHEKTRKYLEKLSPYTQKYADLEEAKKAIDLGFHNLAEMISLIPEKMEARNVDTTIKELETLYSHIIEEPIIKDAYIDEDGKPKLIYPNKSDIFIPQAYKAIRYTGKEQLENEATWKAISTRDDLGTFILSYLSSPYSTLAPLIILGHPGSGKSLLTSILAARLISPTWNPIRVELRSINAENEIAVQIEEQIYKNTNRKVNWATISDHFQDQTTLVLFDGYDELLQASGKVFSGYLLKVQKFQENEQSIGRKPVCAIVTSRITLIDKAEIPRGATIIKLLEFDQEKQQKWISVWNSANMQYFQQTQVEPFELPEHNTKINALAEQPLLLLMLALYDSEGNQLRKHNNLDQTLLYDSLLRRFIQRERMKDEGFKDLKQKEQDKEIDRDFERLGVAAIGMFNRRSFHIKTAELNADLSFFRLERDTSYTEGRMLSQADLLLGSFFFVQESQSVHKNETSKSRDIDTAFEFLHNTFGEFLTADFILRKILAQTHYIYIHRRDEDDEELKAELEKRLASADGFPKDWFACLMYTPLFSRPVILTMMREWVKHCLVHRKRSEKDFLTDLDMIVLNQIKRLLTKNSFPLIMTEDGKIAFGNLPIMGYASIYSLNLILLRTVLSPGEYNFDEEMISPSADGTRTWDRLTYLWRSWFSLESLHELTAILTAERKGMKIHLKAKETPTTSSIGNRLESIMNVSFVLADDITAGLSGFLLYDSFGKNRIDLDDIDRKLRSEKIDLRLEWITKQLRHLGMQGYSYDYARHLIDEFRYEFRNYDFQSYKNLEALISFLKECAKATRMTDRRLGIEIYDLFIRRRSPEAWSPNVALELIKLAREFRDQSYSELLYRENLRRYLRDGLEHRFFEDLPRGLPIELVVELIKLAREFEDQNSLEYFYHEYIRRYLRGNFETRFFDSLLELSVELIVELVKLAREFEDQSSIEYFYHEYIRRYLRDGPEHRFSASLPRELPIELIIEIIKLAREFEDQSTLELWYHEYVSRGKLKVGSLPLDSIGYIRWLANKFNDNRLLAQIDRMIELGPDERIKSIWPTRHKLKE